MHLISSYLFQFYCGLNLWNYSIGTRRNTTEKWFGTFVFSVLIFSLHFDLRSVWDESRNTYVSGYSNEQLVFILILKLIITLAPCSLLSFDLGLGLFSIVGSFSCHKKRLSKLYYAFECFCYSSRFPFLSWRLFLKRFFFFRKLLFMNYFFHIIKWGTVILLFQEKWRILLLTLSNPMLVINKGCLRL